MNLIKRNKEDERYKKIIIKYNEKIPLGYTFRTYNKYPFLKRYITKEEFNDIVDKANIIIHDAKIEKAKFDNIEINYLTYLLFLLALIFIINFIFLFYYSPRTKKNHLGKKITGIIFFCLTIVILVIIEVYYFFKKIEGERALLDFYRINMNAHFEKVNEQWKDSIIFKFDETNKDIVCQVKINGNDKRNYEK